MVSRRVIYATLFAAAVSLLPLSCVRRLDDERMPDGERIMLSLMISAQSDGTFGTRAGGHDLEAALSPENYIDVDKDYRIMIFDGGGRFVQNFSPTYRRISATDAASGKYSIALTGPLTVTEGEIQVMVLTNGEGFDNEWAYPEPGDGDLLTELYTRDSENIFTMPVVADGTGSTSWRPETNRSGIPMFGVSAVVPLSAAVDPTDNDTIDGVKVDGKVLDMGEIMLLRAVAKIEVLRDPAYDADGISLLGVKLSAYNAAGRFIPDVTANPDWGIAATQVVTPTLPADVKRQNGGLSFFRDGTTWRAYVPEMDLRTDCPTLTITAGYASGANDPQEFHIALDKPARPGQLDYLLRNHIYRYKIRSVDLDQTPEQPDPPDPPEITPELEIILDVDPWDEGELNPEFGSSDKDGNVDNDPWDEGDLNPELGSGDKDGSTDSDPWDEGDLNPKFGEEEVEEENNEENNQQ